MTEREDSQPNDQPTRSLALAASHTLHMERTEGGDTLRIQTANGMIAVTLQITERGVHIELAAAELAVRTEGEVRVDAGRIRLHGRDGVDITSDGPLALTADEQRLRATRGDIALEANDDVTLDGERVRLNCAK